MACGTTWGTPPAGTVTTALPRLGQQYAPRRPTAAKGHHGRHVVSLVFRASLAAEPHRARSISTHPREAFLGL